MSGGDGKTVETTGAAHSAPILSDAISGAESASKGLDHAWRYFALHAQQRISVFNFFVVLSAALSTAIGASNQGGQALAPVGVILGGLLALLSYLFWKLDRRGAQLVKISEQAIRSGEELCLPEFARIVGLEMVGYASVDDTLKKHASGKIWTFGRSFRVLFVVMGLLGAFASGYSTLRWFGILPSTYRDTKSQSFGFPGLSKETRGSLYLITCCGA